MPSKSSSKREHVRKDLLEKAKEDNKMQYEEKHKSHALKLKKEIAKETNAKILDVCTKYSTTSLLIHRKYEVQTDMSADMSVQGTRWQAEVSVRAPPLLILYLQSLNVSAAATWQAVIGQPLPRGSLLVASHCHVSGDMAVRRRSRPLSCRRSSRRSMMVNGSWAAVHDGGPSSTTASQRQSKVVNDGGPSLDHWSTTAGTWVEAATWTTQRVPRGKLG
ncbi:hypothetical protein Tco_0280387 [Tanacetum coccineum]